MLTKRILKIVCLLLFASTAIAAQTSGKDTLSILFTGDVLLDRGVRVEIEKRGIDELFSSVSPLFYEADATVINLECPLTDRQTSLNKRFIFRGEPIWAKALAKAGVTHAAMANNHTNDQGREGIRDTYKHLKEAGIAPLGYGITDEERSAPVVIAKGNVKVALFNTVLIPLEGWFPFEGKPGVCQHSTSKLSEVIKEYKRRYPETYIVVVVHWGAEYKTTPSVMQQQDAQKLLQSGADVIVGHHPHVLQPVRKKGKKYVCYSLGNFVFDHKGERESASLIARFDFSTEGIAYSSHEVKIVACKPVLKSGFRKSR
ncbi:MAG: CapA family protein [Porphyromonas sp.]|nr:CapA family protein [Porphyromonas sp.]